MTPNSGFMINYGRCTVQKRKTNYVKGEFRGFMFAQFNNPEDCDYAIQLLKNIGLEGGDNIWAKPDRGFEDLCSAQNGYWINPCGQYRKRVKFNLGLK